jgi:L-fucose isomerase-like protein
MPATTIPETVLQDAPKIQATLFDELTAVSMMVGPWASGPPVFFEDRPAFVTVATAPPTIVPQRTMIGVGT